MERVNRSELVDYAHRNTKRFMEEYYEPDGCGNGYVCKLCGSGLGDKGTGITTRDGVHYTCWTGCFTNSDVFDLIGEEYGIEDFNERLKKYAELMEIEIIEDSKSFRNVERDFSDMLGLSSGKGETEAAADEEDNQTDYTEYFRRCAARIEETDYHRGIRLETLKKYGIGYDPEWESQTEVAKGKHHPKSKRLIIPTSNYSYLARATEKEPKYQKSKVGKVHIFNGSSIFSADKPVFIVEGELDALSILDVGGCAVGLGSVAYIRRFLDLIRGGNIAHGFIIALDNDDAGRKASDALSNEFNACGIRYTVKPELWGNYKDANEFLAADRESFSNVINSVSDSELLAEIEERDLELSKRKEELLEGSNANAFDDFEQSITDPTNRPLSTGLKKLDELMEGGLYPGLCIIGAMSSAGKSTFALQLADNFAGLGEDVLYYSYEMSREQLIAKSISRLTYIEDVSKTGAHMTAKTTTGILCGMRYKNYSNSELDLISAAKAEYKETYAKKIFVKTGSSGMTVSQIKKDTREWVKIFGKAPVIVVDYLQIVPAEPNSRFSTDKERLDHIVHELLWLSRECKNRIIVISSFNRVGYKGSAEMSSFKGSGDIEYTSDALLSLSEYLGEKKEKTFNKEAKQAGLPYMMQIDILKQRLGKKDVTAEIYGNLVFNWYGDDDIEMARKSKAQKNYDGWNDIEDF